MGYVQKYLHSPDVNRLLQETDAGITISTSMDNAYRMMVASRSGPTDTILMGVPVARSI